MSRGQRRERLRFDRPGLDQFGELNGPFAPVFTCSARIQFIRGSETALAGRLQGLSAANITIDSFAASRVVTNAWRCVNIRNGDVFDIKSANVSEDRKTVLILAESGGADGGEKVEPTG